MKYGRATTDLHVHAKSNM